MNTKVIAETSSLPQTHSSIAAKSANNRYDPEGLLPTLFPASTEDNHRPTLVTDQTSAQKCLSNYMANACTNKITALFTISFEM